MKRKNYYPTPPSSSSKKRKPSITVSRTFRPSGFSVGRGVADAFGFVAGSWAAAPVAAAAANIPFVGGYLGPSIAVAGGVRGAAFVDSFFGPTTRFSQMKTNPEKALVNRSAMKVTGKLAIKKAPRKAKISAEFRESVKTVLRSAGSSGHYKTIKSGIVGNLIKDLNGGIIGDDMGSTHTALLHPAYTMPSGSRTLYNALFSWVAGGDSSLIPNTGLNYFTPAKIIDAASVLFNNKRPANPYSSTINNLATTFNIATGANVPTNPGSLKVDIKDSFVKFTIKNCSYRVITMDIWECTPTLKFQNVPALSALAGLINAQSEVAAGNDTNISYWTGNATSSTLNQNLYYENNIDPLYCASKIGFPFKWKKRTMILAPFETCIHNIQGPKGTFDFSKITSFDTTAPIASTVYNFNTLMKGWSVSCVISVHGDQIVQTGGVSTGNRDSHYSTSTNNRISCPVAIEVEETYSIAVPEIAGFISAGGAAGSQQLLNNRKPKLVIWNSLAQNLVTNLNISSNEVNPAASISAGGAQQWL